MFDDWIIVNNVVSSANITYLNVSLEFGESYIHIKNTRGPKLELYGHQW